MGHSLGTKVFITPSLGCVRAKNANSIWEVLGVGVTLGGLGDVGCVLGCWGALSGVWGVLKV